MAQTKVAPIFDTTQDIFFIGKTITLIDTFGEREKVKRFYHVKGLQNEEL